MSFLPSEIILHISDYWAIPQIWRHRRVCKQWHNLMEHAFENRLIQNKTSFLTVRIYLLNSRGGPWFSFSPDSIEDFQAIPLRVISVNKQERLIKFTAQNDEDGKPLEVALNRRRGLDRIQWCVKFRIDPSEHQIPVDGKRDKNKLGTIIAPDTDIDISKAHAVCSVSTIDMQLFYSVFDPQTPLNERETHTPIIFNLKSFDCSYSFLFCKLDYDKHYDYGSWSVHSSKKCNHLLETAKEMGLQWSDRFWNFDLVLHWLTLGEYDSAHGVIEFLREHESVASNGPTHRKSRDRFLLNERI